MGIFHSGRSAAAVHGRGIVAVTKITLWRLLFLSFGGGDLRALSYAGGVVTADFQIRIRFFYHYYFYEFQTRYISTQTTTTAAAAADTRFSRADALTIYNII